MSRWWIGRKLQKLRSRSDRNEMSLPSDCHACTQEAPPVFHSVACGPVQPPQWEASAGSSLFPADKPAPSTANRRDSAPHIFDPRSPRVRKWNRLIVLARGVSLALDPLFFFALTISGAGDKLCICMDGGFAAFVGAARTLMDAFYACHVWLQFRLAYVSKESLAVGSGKLVWDARAIASHYLHSLTGFWLDVFVVLPIPQAMYWLVLPRLLRASKISLVMNLVQVTFLLQFLPKVYHSFCLTRAMRKATGYVFGSIWWGFGLNFVAYFVASHASGGYWYLLSIRRIASCLIQQCDKSSGCELSLTCLRKGCGYECGDPTSKVPACLDPDGTFPFGIYEFALPLMSSNSVIVVKVLYSNLWGLLALSTMGNNLEPTSHCLEVFFSIYMVLAGLLLFTLLVGNIQVFLHAIFMRKKKAQLIYRDTEWWMKHRKLPSHLRQRVRRHEHQRWDTLEGQDEMELIKDLPLGLRRDIKRYLCLDLIKKVPLFHNLDDLILDNICDRVRQQVYSSGEKMLREGDLVQRMTFIVRGIVKRTQKLRRHSVVTAILDPGSFLGDELITWCIRRPFVDRLPTSSATFTCVEPVEAYVLEADDLKYIANHFCYRFSSERLRRTARYYSSNWRTWAAVNIQLAWRQYLRRSRDYAVNYATGSGGDENEYCLRRYATLFLSLKPHDHLE